MQVTLHIQGVRDMLAGALRYLVSASVWLHDGSMHTVVIIPFTYLNLSSARCINAICLGCNVLFFCLCYLQDRCVTDSCLSNQLLLD